jgi:hypothetical protein
MQVDIVSDVEVQISIAIIVKKSASRPPTGVAFIGQSCLLGDIGEGAIAIVTIKNILTIISDENILKTVVVIVSNGYSAGPPGTY